MKRVYFFSEYTLSLCTLDYVILRAHSGLKNMEEFVLTLALVSKKTELLQLLKLRILFYFIPLEFFSIFQEQEFFFENFEQKAKKIEREGPRLPLYSIYECDDFKRKFFLFIYISKAMKIHFRSEMVMMGAKLTR